MKIFSTKNEITDYFNRKPVKVIGFVPTMGALHKGHLGLIELAKQQSTQVVCSIFVNPTQFNDPKDLEKYPRPITDDIRRLEEVDCDILFNPQVMVISKMVEVLKMPVKLVMCPIEREPDGLAMSSRNIHLTPYDREHSLILSKTLNWVKENFDINKIDALQQQAAQMISSEPGVELEYFEIADGKTLHPATPASESIVALVAARVGKTRLIDNVLIG